MTPSNPTNGQPLIYRIMDALGVSHLVACINHTHEQSEVEGLTTALNSKAPINHSHDSIGEDTDESYADVTANEGTVHIEVRNQSGGGECEITPSNIGNFIRALDTPDATPTTNSDKLVTSGGVKAALDGKMDNDTVIIPTGAIAKPIPQHVTVDGGTGLFDIDTLFDVGNSAADLGMARVLLVNDIGQDEVANLIESREYDLPIHANSHGTAQINQGESVLLTIYKMDKATVSHEHDWCYYVTIDGIFDELTPQQ